MAIFDILLLSRPHQSKNECIVSYLIRVSECNGFPHLGMLLSSAGLGWKNNRAPVRDILKGEFDLSGLLEELGLASFSAQSTSRVQEFRKGIDTAYCFSRHPRICPECLEEKGYCDYSWAFLPIVCCVEHRCSLVDFDQSTGKNLSWYRRELIPHVEKSDRNKLSDDIEPHLYDMTSYFLSLLNNRTNSKRYGMFATLDFKEALTALNFVAHYVCRATGERFRPATLDLLSLSEIYAKSWCALTGLSGGLNDLFESFEKKPMSPRGSSGISRHYRDMTEKLYRQRENKGIQLIQKEFEGFLSERWHGYLNIDRLTRLELNTDQYDALSQKSAAEFLSCRPETIRKYVKRGKLSELIFKGRKHYSKREVNLLAKELLDNWTMAQACEELEVTRYKLKCLLESNTLPYLERPVSGKRAWLIDRQGCIEIIESLKSGANSSSKRIGKSLSGFQKNGYDIAAVLSGMSSGEILYSFESRVGKQYSFRQFSNFGFAD